MTWSARSRSDCGMMRPRALAVFRLIEIELRWLLNRQIGWLCAFKLRSTKAAPHIRISESRQTAPKRQDADVLPGRRPAHEDADTRDSPRLLRAGAERRGEHGSQASDHRASPRCYVRPSHERTCGF